MLAVHVLAAAALVEVARLYDSRIRRSDSTSAELDKDVTLAAVPDRQEPCCTSANYSQV
jgi:hypothetical protein